MFHFCFFVCLFVLFLHLKGRSIDEGGKTERSAICGFIPKIATTAGKGLDQSKEPELPSRSPMWVNGCKNVWRLLLISQAHWQGARSEVQQLGGDQVLRWDGSILAGSLTYSTTLTPIMFHL